METIFIIGAVQAFFIALQIFSKNPKTTGDYVLGYWLAYIGLHLLFYYLFSIGLFENNPSLFAMGSCFPLLQGPFMFVYVLTMIDKENRFDKKYWLHALPFVFFNLFFLFDFYPLEFEEKIAYLEKAKTREFPMAAILNYLNVFLGPVYLILSLLKLNVHSKNIDEVYSFHENIDLKWLKYVLIGMGIVWVTVVFAFSLSTVFPLQVKWLSHSIYVAVTFSVFFLGYFGLKQQVIYFPYQPDPKAKQPLPNKRKIPTVHQYERSGLKPDDALRYLGLLQAYMVTDKPYLNGKLSLAEVADALEISPNHLSEVINGKLNQNFFDFINGYRVNQVKEMMADPNYSNYTLLGLALECGFNSKSSFNAIFKKTTGKTPTEYLKSL